MRVTQLRSGDVAHRRVAALVADHADHLQSIGEIFRAKLVEIRDRVATSKWRGAAGKALFQLRPQAL